MEKGDRPVDYNRLMVNVCSGSFTPKPILKSSQLHYKQHRDMNQGQLQLQPQHQSSVTSTSTSTSSASQPQSRVRSRSYSQGQDSTSGGSSGDGDGAAVGSSGSVGLGQFNPDDEPSLSSAQIIALVEEVSESSSIYILNIYLQIVKINIVSIDRLRSETGR